MTSLPDKNCGLFFDYPQKMLKNYTVLGAKLPNLQWLGGSPYISSH